MTDKSKDKKEKVFTGNGYSPPCRKGAMCTILEVDNSLWVDQATEKPNHLFVVYGGQVSKTSMRNDTWVSSTSRTRETATQWLQLSRNIAAPEKRWKGTLASIKPVKKGETGTGSYALLFGGSDCIDPAQPDEEFYYNDLWKLSLSSSSTPLWQNVSNTGVKPSARRAHTAVDFSIGNTEQMLVFAGKNSKNAVLSDLWFYSVEKNEWTEFKTPQFPGQDRKGHSAVSFIKDSIVCMIVYGGRVDDYTYLDDMTIFCQSEDLKDANWWRVLYDKSGVVGKDYPEARNHHSAEFYNGVFYAFGGRSSYESTATHEDIWAFDFSTLDMNILFTNKDKLLLKNRKWEKLQPSNHGDINVYSGRIEHCTDILDETIFLFGGQDSLDNRKNDLVSLDLKNDLFETIHYDDCNMLGAELASEGNLPLIIGFLVLIVGCALFYQKFRQNQRQGYRRLR
eukprot:snap_masked-scaffold_7-processed-gene-1.8-mRNA-1 protein AED:1.00 eAED:1.00 QI:0/-1/0/0/-1/1/1/0/450